MKTIKELFLELEDFVAENGDAELSDRLHESIGHALTDENGNGEYKKSILALADVVSTFLHLGASKATAPLSVYDILNDLFYPMLLYYCAGGDEEAFNENGLWNRK